MHSCLTDTFFHITETLDVSICKHRNAHSFSVPVNRTDAQNWELESAQKFYSCHTNLFALQCHCALRVCGNPLRLVLLTNLTAWMCSQDATPASGPFCSFVRPCTVSSWNTTLHLLLTRMSHWNKSTDKKIPFTPYASQMPLSSHCYFRRDVGITEIAQQHISHSEVLGFFQLAISWHDKNVPTDFPLCWLPLVIHFGICDILIWFAPQQKA